MKPLARCASQSIVQDLCVKVLTDVQYGKSLGVLIALADDRPSGRLHTEATRANRVQLLTVFSLLLIEDQ